MAGIDPVDRSSRPSLEDCLPTDVLALGQSLTRRTIASRAIVAHRNVLRDRRRQLAEADRAALRRVDIDELDALVAAAAVLFKLDEPA